MIVPGSAYTIRHLPPVGAVIHTLRGGAYQVVGIVPDDREHPDSAKGYVFARRIDKAGVVVGRRSIRISPSEIIDAEVAA